MSNYEINKKIATCEDEMAVLMHEFMSTTDFVSANEKLDELVRMSTQVGELKAQKKNNGLFTRIKTKLGL